MPAPGTYVLAVDGGGTKCVAVLIHPQRGRVAMGHGGPCNPQAAGREQAVRALAKAIGEACRDLPPDASLHVAAFGLAGVDTPAGYAAARALAAHALQEVGVTCRQVVVENDAVLALHGAAAGGRGVLVAAGTGSIVCASDGRRHVRVGGWGHRVGDCGSAYHLVQEALAAAFRWFDGLPPATDLGRFLCAAAGVSDLPALHDWLYHPARRVDEVAALAPAVEQAAGAGDGVAASILERAGQALAEAAVAAARRAGILDGAPFPVFLMGGVLQHATRLRQALLAALAQHLPAGTPQLPRFHPVLGAALVALGGRDAVPPDLLDALAHHLRL